MTNKEINAEKLNVELFELENKMKKLQEFVDSDDFLSISTINQMLLANLIKWLVWQCIEIVCINALN